MALNRFLISEHLMRYRPNLHRDLAFMNWLMTLRFLFDRSKTNMMLLSTSLSIFLTAFLRAKARIS